MSFNYGREEKKWRLWKEAEEKKLRGLGVDEDTIEKLHTYDWAVFNSDRRYYRRLKETGTYLEDVAEETMQPEVKTVADFLDSIENPLRKFDKETLFQEISEMIRFYQEADILDLVDLDYRIKSEDSCIRKYNKFYPDMRLEKVFNDILGFRMLTDSYTSLLEGEMLEEVRIVDMSHGKAKDDGYRGVHIYFQPDHFHYPIEIQANTYYDRQLNNWLHKYLYKREYPDSVGRILRSEYESGKILSEQQFEEVLSYVLSHCERIFESTFYH